MICSSLPSKVDVTKYSHLDNLEFADDFDVTSNDTIDIVIGSDYYWNVVNGEAVRGESGPTAVNSKLGWLLSGPVGGNSSDHVNSHLAITGEFKSLFETNEHDELVNTLKEFWETESIGIKEQVEESSGNSFIKDLSYDGKRYVVGLPWKESREAIPSEYQLCRNRLNSLHLKLKRDPELLNEYDNIIKEHSFKWASSKNLKSNLTTNSTKTFIICLIPLFCAETEKLPRFEWYTMAQQSHQETSIP